MKTEERFWSNVRKEFLGCWLWEGPVNNSGYGSVRINGKTHGVHRYSYSLMRGEIPENLDIDHLCRVRICVNPNHMEPVSHRENMLRGNTWAADHARRTHCPQGHPLIPSNLVASEKSRKCKTCTYAKNEARRQLRRTERRVLQVVRTV